MNHYQRPAQRLLVQGVLASTIQLVRFLRDGGETVELRRLMSERRRMLRALAAGQEGPVDSQRMRALQAAVAESDRTMEALMA